jgi:RNA polymerase sigma-70 factor (ECF subfamily)
MGLPEHASAGQLDARIVAARQGAPEALGQALESCRHYLLLIAHQQTDATLAVKMAPSDLVQETMLKAHEDFRQFHGQSEAELLAWLRQILLNTVRDAGRKYRESQKRNLGRELPQGASQQHDPYEHLQDEGKSPSSAAAAHEQDEELHKALGRLAPERLQVVRWRNYDRLSFEEIGERLGRSADAARKLWERALKELEDLLEPPDDAQPR